MIETTSAIPDTEKNNGLAGVSDLVRTLRERAEQEPARESTLLKNRSAILEREPMDIVHHGDPH